MARPRLCAFCKTVDATRLVGIALDDDRPRGGIPVEVVTCDGCFDEARRTLERWDEAIRGHAQRRCLPGSNAKEA